MGAEKKVEDYFVARIEEDGGEVRKLKWIGRRGAPDRFVAVFYWNGLAEIKAPGEELEAHQEREVERLRKLGVNVVVLDSVEAVDLFIKNAKRVYKFKQTENIKDLIA